MCFAAAACTARAADGVEIVGVSENSNKPSRSLTLSAPKIENRRADAGAAKDDRLFDVRARQQIRARGFERERNALSAVSVRVRLDDGNDLGARRAGHRWIRGAFGEKLLNRFEVGLQRREIDVRDRAADHSNGVDVIFAALRVVRAHLSQ